MLYSSEHRLFFVHIPKCAGLSINQSLSSIATFPFSEMAADMNMAEGVAASEIGAFGFEHPILGNIHRAHIPLRFLRDYFPVTWDAFLNAESFAVTRDPRDRFLSAIMQRLREFRGIGATKADLPLIRSEAENAVAWLSSRTDFCDLDYIHFARQIDYVKLDGKQLVSRLFSLNKMHELDAWLTNTYGVLPLPAAEKNQSWQVRKWARGIRPIVGSIARIALMERMRKTLYPLWLKSGAFVPAASQYKNMDLGAAVEGFIRSYYAEDAALYLQASRSRIVESRRSAVGSGH
jgi:hypothetical protein